MISYFPEKIFTNNGFFFFGDDVTKWMITDKFIQINPRIKVFFNNKEK